MFSGWPRKRTSNLRVNVYSPSNSMILVPLFDLKFQAELAASVAGTSNRAALDLDPAVSYGVDMDAGLTETRKARARAWFEQLRTNICAAFEAIGGALP